MRYETSDNLHRNTDCEKENNNRNRLELKGIDRKR